MLANGCGRERLLNKRVRERKREKERGTHTHTPTHLFSPPLSWCSLSSNVCEWFDLPDFNISLDIPEGLGHSVGSLAVCIPPGISRTKIFHPPESHSSPPTSKNENHWDGSKPPAPLTKKTYWRNDVRFLKSKLSQRRTKLPNPQAYQPGLSLLSRSSFCLKWDSRVKSTRCDAQRPLTCSPALNTLAWLRHFAANMWPSNKSWALEHSRTFHRCL